MHAVQTQTDHPVPSPVVKPTDRRQLLLLFLLVAAFTFACRTAFFWHDGALLAGLHADEPFHYAAELVRLSPDHYPGDLSVQATRKLGEPYESFYGAVVWLVKRTDLSLMQVTFLICWTANVVYLAGLMLLLHRLGLSPWLCALGTVLASQRFALLTGQTLVTHGLAIPREVWQALLPWFLLWFVFGTRHGWRLVLFYGALGLVFTGTYPLWAVCLGVSFGLVDLWNIILRKDWRGLGWLCLGAFVCLAAVAAVYVGQYSRLSSEETALLERTLHSRAIYTTKGFRRFVLFSTLGLWAFWELGKGFRSNNPAGRRLWQVWVVTTVVAWIYQPLETPFRTLSMIYLGRVSLLNFIVSMVAVTVCLQHRFAAFHFWKKWFLIAGAVALCVFPLRSAYHSRFDRSLMEFCRLVKARTPVEALFLVPPVEDVQNFRVYAERGMWFAPYDKTTLWISKPLYQLRSERDTILKTFYAPPASDAERAAILKRVRDEGVDYVVTRMDASWSDTISTNVVLRHGPWELRALR
jgi:hypothetical protein